MRKPSWWHEYVLQYTSDNGGGNDGGTGGEDTTNNGGGGGGGNQQQQQKPEWASEFGDNFDPEKAWSLIKTLRSETRGKDKAVNDLAKKVKEFEDKDKTELEKLQAQIQELLDENNAFKQKEKFAKARASVRDVAAKEGAIYPDDIYRLLDESEFDMDDEGTLKNADKLVKQLVENRPQLFQRRGADGFTQPSGGQNPAGGDFNRMIRRAAGRNV